MRHLSLRGAGTLLSILFLSGCGGPAVTFHPAHVGDPRVGSRLFVADHCVRCHSVNGTGGQVGPDLSGDGIASQPQQLKAFLADPPEVMSFVKGLHLTDQQIADISAFAASGLKPKK